MATKSSYETDVKKNSLRFTQSTESTIQFDLNVNSIHCIRRLLDKNRKRSATDVANEVNEKCVWRILYLQQ